MKIIFPWRNETIMNIKKTLLLALPLLGVAVGGLVAFGSKKASVVEAADYSTPNRSLEVDDDGNVSANFTVTNEDFDLTLGWLLCLFDNKPAYDVDTRKLNNSNELHPYSNVSGCAHYFFAASEEDSGEIIINWESTLADQKVAWSETKAEGAAGQQLKDYFAEKDWHIVIGPRHQEGAKQWGGDDPDKYAIGEGLNYVWENCDYYIGQKSALLNGVDGQTYLDLSKYTGWEDADAKFGFYYFDESVSPKKEGWSEGFATSSGFDHIYRAQYSLDFVPKKMIAVRFNNNADTLRWNTSPTENYVWGQSSDEDFYEYGVSGVEYKDEQVQYWSYAMASVKFSDTNKVALDHLKRNTYGNSENFNQGFPLRVGQEFDIDFENVTYSTFEIQSSLTSNFDTTSVSGKVKVLVGGIYALYFNTDTHSLYITTVALAEADEWSIAFLGSNCDSTIANWDKCKTDYLHNISDEAKEILKSEEHVAHDAKVTGYIALAMQRYDFLVSSFEGYDDYIGRCDSQHFSPYQSSASVTSNGEDDTSMLVIVVAAVSLLALTTLLVIKKRKSIR